MQILAPQHNTQLLGQTAAIDSFMQAVQTRLHHAWLFHGAEGIGKATFAYHCANHLLSNGKQIIGALNAQNADFKLIASGAHPDLLVLSPPVDEKTGLVKDEIPVAQVRALTAFFQKTSGRDGWRIAMIQGADQLNRNAANALLKILEEPPHRALLLMTASARGKLLPTIRSRCRPLGLEPLSITQLQAVLQGYQDELSTDDARQLQQLSNGSPGYALTILQNDGLQLYRDFLELLQTSHREQAAALLRFAGNGGKQENERFNLIARFCEDWLAKLLHLAATGEAKEVISGEAQLMRRMAAVRSIDGWFSVLTHCQQQNNTATHASLDKRLVLINNLQQLFVAA
jgi:DNA polymerase-3 subunit delta'